jgi:Putative lumazine-binding
MKKLALIISVVAIAAAFSFLPAHGQNAEEAGVRQPLDNYIKGHSTGQGEYFRKAFHPDAKLFAVRDGKYWQLTSEEYIARASGKPADDEAQRKRVIESIDISGNAAIAKVVLDYPAVRFTDYMSLLKIDGEWKIINKTFYAEAKAKN